MFDLTSKMREVTLLEGDFTLRSGRKSRYYLDVRRAYRDPELLNQLVDSLYALLDDAEPTCVAGIGLGGQTLAAVMASRHGLRLTQLRDEAKAHGTGNQIEVYKPTPEDRVIVPDDIFTTGSSLLRATEILKPTGAQIVRYGVIANREEGDPSVLPAPLVWLITAKKIMGN
ncbi:MAG: phosphoribosyltransferase family protein [Nanoarchaeota archaeon]